MKVGIITFQNSYKSYGAALQNLAMQEILIRKGFNCETIDLLRPIHKRYNRNHTPKKRPFTIWNFKRTIFNAFDYFFFTRQKTYNFKSFNKKISMSKSYNSHEALEKDPPLYEAYITGSDQVWNPNYPFPLSPYFLTFVPNGRKKISYAPSFGVSIIPTSCKPIFSEWLNKIDFISVRENEGANIIKELTGKDVNVLLDPTLLLTSKEWEEISAPTNIPGPYILCYDLGNQHQIMKLCYHLKQITGYGIIKIGNNWKDYFQSGIKAMNDVGPSEFLGLIQNSEIVVTNSFHATAFAINWNKPFYSLPTDFANQEISKNSRLINILKILDLSDRLFLNDSPLPSSSDIKIDFSRANVLLQQEKVKSFNFLDMALLT